MFKNVIVQRIHGIVEGGRGGHVVGVYKCFSLSVLFVTSLPCLPCHSLQFAWRLWYVSLEPPWHTPGVQGRVGN